MNITTELKTKIRKDLGQLTHRQIAVKYGVGVGSVSRIRNENACPKLKVDKKNPRICPVPSLRKWEMNWLHRHKCKHNMPYFMHYECFIEECDNVIREERVGFFDIEATNLKASFGIVICYCIKISGSDEIIQRSVTPRELMKHLDKKLMIDMVKDLEGFDRIIGHYSSRFDLPFIRTRAIKHGVSFPEFGSIYQTDTWRMARSKLAMHSNRLQALEEFFLENDIDTKKTPITPEHWQGATVQHKQECLDYILDHCRRDVIILEQCYELIKPYVMKTNTSI